MRLAGVGEGVLMGRRIETTCRGATWKAARRLYALSTSTTFFLRRRSEYDPDDRWPDAQHVRDDLAYLAICFALFGWRVNPHPRLVRRKPLDAHLSRTSS